MDHKLDVCIIGPPLSGRVTLCHSLLEACRGTQSLGELTLNEGVFRGSTLGRLFVEWRIDRTVIRFNAVSGSTPVESQRVLISESQLCIVVWRVYPETEWEWNERGDGSAEFEDLRRLVALVGSRPWIGVLNGVNQAGIAEALRNEKVLRSLGPLGVFSIVATDPSDPGVLQLVGFLRTFASNPAVAPHHE